MRRRAAVIVALGLSAFLYQVADASAQSEASALALGRWIDAVVSHQPGSPDQSAAVTASLTLEQRIALDPAMEFFLEAIRGRVDRAQDAAQRRILDSYLAIRKAPGVGPFLRRAAILHTDAAIFAVRLPAPADDSLSPAAAAQLRRQAPSPLISARRVVTQIDGRILGQTMADWNWPFARLLLDLLLPSDWRAVTPEPGFVAAWYHATDAYLMGNGNMAELRAQLERAAVVLPNDPRVLFDRGCYEEGFGLPYNQALRDDPDLRATRGVSVSIPSEESANGRAEALFRRVVALDPAYGEAHARLARILERDGRYNDAAREVEQALAAPADPPVVFYAHLIGGRVAAALELPRESLDHYTAALTAFPDAQSALLGASHAALIGADPAAAVSFTRRLGERSQNLAADPWWSYRLGAGRDAATLVRALWARTLEP